MGFVSKAELHRYQERMLERMQKRSHLTQNALAAPLLNPPVELLRQRIPDGTNGTTRIRYSVQDFVPASKICRKLFTGGAESSTLRERPSQHGIPRTKRSSLTESPATCTAQSRTPTAANNDNERSADTIIARPSRYRSDESPGVRGWRPSPGPVNGGALKIVRVRPPPCVLFADFWG